MADASAGHMAAPVSGAAIAESKSTAGTKKKICCACPDTKRERDECVILNGEEGNSDEEYNMG